MAYLMMVSIAQTTMRWTAGRSATELAMYWCKVLSWHVSGDTEGNHEKTQRAYFVPRFEPGTFQIKVWSVTTWISLLSLSQMSYFKYTHINLEVSEPHCTNKVNDPKSKFKGYSDNKKNRVDLCSLQQWLWRYYLLDVTLYSLVIHPSFGECNTFLFRIKE